MYTYMYTHHIFYTLYIMCKEAQCLMDTFVTVLAAAAFCLPLKNEFGEWSQKE